MFASYEEACAEHSWNVPERYNIAADVCDKHPRDKLAMVNMTMAHLANSLSLHVVAEGVETRPQWDFLRDNRESKIVPDSAFVAGLEVVAVYIHDRAVGQVVKRTGDRVCTCIID